MQSTNPRNGRRQNGRKSHRKKRRKKIWKRNNRRIWTRRRRRLDGNELSAVEKHIRTINKTLERRTNEEKANAREQLTQFTRQLTQEQGIHDELVLDKKKKKFIREAGKVDAVNCLFNPKSFTQTVENIFHFSFAVKAGSADIKVRGAKEAEEFGLEPGPMVLGRDLNQENSNTTAPPKQAIVSLSMKVSFFSVTTMSFSLKLR